MERDLRVSFTGYYGMRNFGDDLFGVICAAAARQFWDARPKLVGPAQVAMATPCTMPPWFPAEAYGGAGIVGKAARLYSFLGGMRDTDLLVMGGGSVINGRKSFREPMMLSADRRKRLQLAAIGVSVGPFEHRALRDSAKAFISRLTYLAVRDRRSYELALEIGAGARIHWGRDLAGLLPVLLPSRAPRPLPAPGEELRIGVAPARFAPRPGYPAPSVRALHDSIVESLKVLGARYRLQVDVFCLNGHAVHGDMQLAQALHQALADCGVAARRVDYRHGDPLATARALGECNAVISTRLHGAIVAYVLGVPFMIVDYHPKCADFASDIDLPASRRITAGHDGRAAFSRGLETMLAGEEVPGLPAAEYSRQAQEVFRRAPWANGAP